MFWSPLALLTALALALHSYHRGSLDQSGAATAFVLGYLTLANDSLVFTAALLIFFFTSSRLTRYKRERKAQVEEHWPKASTTPSRGKVDDDGHSPPTGRNGIQVLSNGLTGTACAVLWQVYCAHHGTHPCLSSKKSRALIFGAIAHYSSCCADTWASELGILSKSRPIMITTLKQTEPGVNGAISSVGLTASVAGGSVVGLTSAIVLKYECPISWLSVFGITLFGAVMGTMGSLLDSWLGATCQETLWNRTTKKVITGADQRYLKDSTIVTISGRPILSNDQVNFVSSATIATLAMILSWPF